VCHIIGSLVSTYYTYIGCNLSNSGVEWKIWNMSYSQVKCTSYSNGGSICAHELLGPIARLASVPWTFEILQPFSESLSEHETGFIILRLFKERGVAPRSDRFENHVIKLVAGIYVLLWKEVWSLGRQCVQKVDFIVVYSAFILLSTVSCFNRLVLNLRLKLCVATIVICIDKLLRVKIVQMNVVELRHRYGYRFVHSGYGRAI